MKQFPLFLALCLGWLVFFAPGASAQLELPKGKGSQGEKEAPAGQIPHLVCLTCQTPNYVTTIEPAAKQGKQKAWCLQCQNVRYFERQDPARLGKSGGLDLPAKGEDGQKETKGPGDPAGATGSGIVSPAQGTDPGGATTAARSIFEDIQRLKHSDPTVLRSAAEGLNALGEPGMVQARMNLASQNGNVLLVATRTLLQNGVAEDSQVVARRLQQPLPPKSSKALVQQFIELNPVAASPKWLASMLDHRQNPARIAAYRSLKKLSARADGAASSWLEFLTPLLSAKNADTRYRALDVMGELPEDLILDQVLEALGDSKAKVARKAVDILVASKSERVDPELHVRAFGSQWILRENAYAILTLVEREDKYLKPQLHKGHIEALLRGMDMSEPMVQNTSALALAGIGFRLEEKTESNWLDTKVMDRMVSVVAAVRFFDDRTALVEPSQRRLQLLTGRNFGQNGPAWAKWWVSNRTSFKASRAAMQYSAEDHKSMSVFYADRRTGVVMEFLGPDRLFRTEEPATHERYYLDQVQAQELLRVMEEQGALGPQQPPGPRGVKALQGQELVIRLGGAAKTFALGPKREEAWFETLAQYVQAMRQRVDWQDFYLSKDFVDKREWVLATWQNGGLPDSEPALSAWHRKVYLDWVEAQPYGRRARGLEALTKTVGYGQGPGPMEFDRLLSLLGQERSLGRDGLALFELCQVAAGLDTDGTVSEEASLLGERLLGTLMERFGESGIPQIGEVLSRLGEERLRLALTDPSHLLRAAGGVRWLDGPLETRLWESVERLFRDPNSIVVAQMLMGAGLKNRQEALPFALGLAVESDKPVREKAIRALGRLGGDSARETLMVALTDPSGDFRKVAAEGLADLKDPKAAPIMVALLRNGREQGIQEPLRRGLLSLGEGGHDSLMTALASPHPFTRREAALILGKQDVARAASALLRLVSEDPTDSEVLQTLIGLSCVDLTRADDRSEAWWGWWDSVRQEDSFSWFLAACTTRGMPVPQPIDEHFFRIRERNDEGRPVGSRLTTDGAAFLLEAMRLEETWLAERAWREWQRRSDQPLNPLPNSVEARHGWVQNLVETLSQGR